MPSWTPSGSGCRSAGEAAGWKTSTTPWSASIAAPAPKAFGPEVKHRIMLGTYALSTGYYDAYYKKALKVRRLIRQDYDRAFEEVDLIAGPVTPTPAYKIGEKVDDPLAMYLFDLYTVSTNLAGLPGISLPCGYSSSGLPIGLQLQAPPFEEERCSAGRRCSRGRRIGMSGSRRWAERVSAASTNGSSGVRIRICMQNLLPMQYLGGGEK